MIRSTALKRRVGAATAAGGVVVALVTVATPASASNLVTGNESCTFTDGAITANSVTNPNLVGISPTDTITYSCTGFNAGQSLAIAEANGYAGIDTANQQAYAGKLDLSASSDGSGNVNGSFQLGAFTANAGNSNANCPPTQAQVNIGISCSLAIAYIASQQNGASVQLGYTGLAPATTPSVSVNASYRPGASVTLSGSGFWGAPVTGSSSATSPVPAPTVLLDNAPVTNTAATSAATTSSSGGTLSGGLTLPNTITPGTHSLIVLQPNTTPYAGNAPALLGGAQAVYAATQFSVNGPTASALPAAGNVGTIVNITGDNWTPGGATPTVAFSDGSATGTGSVDGSGHLTASITVAPGTALGSNPIDITQGTLSKSAAFNVTNIPTLKQTIDQEVDPGVLSDSQSASTVTLTPLTLNGTEQTGTGSLNAVTVIDARGTFPGWTLNGQLEGDFVNSGATIHNTIPAGNLSAVPSVALSVASPASGVLSEVSAGTSGALSATTASNLAHAAAGGGAGSFSIGAALSLDVPPFVASGTYTGVLDITLA